MAAYEVVIDSRNQTDPAIKAAIANFQNLDKYIGTIANRISSQTSHMNKKFNQVIAALQGMKAPVAAADTSVKNLGTTTEKTGQQIGGIVGHFDALGYAAYRVGSVFDQYLGRQIRDFGSSAIDVARSFSRSMGEIQTIMQGGLDETTQRAGEYKEELIGLSNDMGIAFEDMAGGFYESISAFGEGEDAMEQFAIAAKVAKAGITDTTNAVDLLSSVSLAYGDTSTSMLQHISDLSFETVRLTKTHIPELASSISKVAPYAADLGVGLEEMFAASATLIGVTGNTAETMTQLRRVMISLQKPNTTMVELLKELGYEGAQAGRAIIDDKGVVGAIQAVRAAADSSGISIEKAVGRVQGIMSALALSGDQAGRFNEMLGEMQDVTGSTEEAFEKMTEGINESGHALDQAETRFENAKAAIGEDLMELKATLTEFAAALVESYSEMSEFGQVMTLVGGGLVAALGPMTQMLASVSILAKNMPALSDAFKGFAATIKGIAAASAGMLGVVGAVGALGVGIGVLVNNRRTAQLQEINDQFGDLVENAGYAEKQIEALQYSIELFSKDMVSGSGVFKDIGLDELEEKMRHFGEQSQISYEHTLDIALASRHISDELREQIRLLDNRLTYEKGIAQAREREVQDFLQLSMMKTANEEERMAETTRYLASVRAAREAERLAAEEEAAAAALAEEEKKQKIIANTTEIIAAYEQSILGIQRLFEWNIIGQGEMTLRQIEAAGKLYEDIFTQETYGRLPYSGGTDSIGDAAMRNAIQSVADLSKEIDGMNDEQLKDVRDTLKDVTDIFVRTDWGDYAQAFKDQLMDSFKAVGMSIKEINDLFKEVERDRVQEIMDGLASSMENIHSRMSVGGSGRSRDTITSELEAYIKAVNDLQAVGTDEALSKIGRLVLKIADLEEELERLEKQAAFERIMDSLGSSEWDQYNSRLDELREATKGVANETQKAALEYEILLTQVEFAADGLGQFMSVLEGTFDTFRAFDEEGAGAGISSLGGVLSGAGAMVAMVEPITGAIVTAIGEAMKIIGRLIQDSSGWWLASEAKNIGEEMSNHIVDGILSGASSADTEKAVRDAVARSMAAYFIETREVEGEIRRMVKDAWRDDSSFDSDEVSEITTFAQGEIDAITQLLEDAGLIIEEAAVDFEDAATSSMKSAAEGISKSGDIIVQTFESINDSIISAVSGGNSPKDAIMDYVKNEIVSAFLLTPEVNAQLQAGLSRVFNQNYDFLTEEAARASMPDYDDVVARAQSSAQYLRGIDNNPRYLSGLVRTYERFGRDRSARNDWLGTLPDRVGEELGAYMNAVRRLSAYNDASVLERNVNEFMPNLDDIVSDVEDRASLLEELFPELFGEGDVVGGDTNVTAGETTVTRAPDQYFTINNYGVFVDRDEWIEDMKEEFAKDNEVVVVQR